MKAYFKKNHFKILAIVLSAIGVFAWLVFYNLDLTTIYSDAMSHLDVARLVVDNLQPGMSQLGSVWLPLSHILMLPFISNDILWHSGLAGAIISITSYVVAALALYKIIFQLSGSYLASLIASLVFALNLNMLYLQSTALTEPLYIALFMTTVLLLVKYLQSHSLRALIGISALSFFGILTRYDAWFVALVIGIIVITNEHVIRKKTIADTFGQFVLFALPVLFGLFLWLGWNLLIFGDALYSFTGPYSAHAQQTVIESTGGLITKSNFAISSWAYILATIDNIGSIVTPLGIIGWIIYLIFGYRQKPLFKLFIFIALFSVIAFNILALYLGFSILNVPGLHWNPSGTKAGELFNVRYGILALPFIAIGIGLLLATIQKKFRPALFWIVIVVIFLQGYIILTQGIITIQDGLTGSSAFVNQDIAKQISTHVKKGDRVIMSTSSYNAVTFRSGLDLKTFIHEGVSKEWNGAISKPEEYAAWLVIANNNVGEPVYTSLVTNQHSAFLKNYHLVFKGTYASLYKRNF